MTGRGGDRVPGTRCLPILRWAEELTQHPLNIRCEMGDALGGERERAEGVSGLRGRDILALYIRCLEL